MDAKRVNKLNIKDFIKDSPGSRLQSLRLPRDLSLGGTKVTKKIYKPNLNVVRNKHKVEEIFKGSDKRINLKCKFQQKQKFIQSTGVFSEGVGDLIRLPEKRSHVKEPEKAQPLLKNIQATDKKSETEVFDELIRYQNDSDNDQDEKVSFAPINWNISKLFKDSVKDEVKSKCPNPELENFNILPLQYSDYRKSTNSNASLTLWQLPDSFAFKKKAENSKNKKLIDCKLTDLPEGRIGKIYIRKSGKIGVFIGNLKYELESADFDSFMEELVALDAKCPQDSSAAVLGKIEGRFVLNPCWRSILG